METNGIWSLDEAKSQHFYSETLAANLAKYFEASEKVFDFGCGVGFYADYFHHNGLSVRAFEGTPDIGKIALFPSIEQRDLSQPFNLEEKADILCLEVGEHIPPEFEAIFFENLFTHADQKIVLSWAVPGQGGHGHFNEKPNSYVIDKMAANGFKYKYGESVLLRQEIGNCRWFKDTIMVFERV